jgi:hypothetical protein
MLASSFTASTRRHTTYERSALMADGIRWVGLDVHAHESTIAIFDQATGEVITERVVGRPHELMPWLRGVQRPARMVYEAGPTGRSKGQHRRAVQIRAALDLELQEK